MAKTVGIVSLGCPRALVDSELLLGDLVKRGYKISDEISGSDIAVVNTCAFIREATEESIDTILELIELKKEGRVGHIIVAGCLPQRYKSNLVDELKEVDAFIGTDGQAIKNVTHRYPLTPSHYAYLKISEGCLHRCSFCVIPDIKGALRSRPIGSLLQEAERLCKEQGVKELILIGQDTSAYGVDIDKVPQISRLLSDLSRIKDLNWLRLLYTHPAGVNDELLKIIRDVPNICKYLDIPVEHINDRILKRMRRGITKYQTLKLIERIRKEIPHITLRTSIIVGFPGETDEEFKELLDFIRDIRFEKLGAFTYSKEEGSDSYNFSDQIPQRVKEQRLEALMKEQQEISEKILQRYVGQKMKVLIDEVDENDPSVYTGRTQYDAPEVDGVVYIKSPLLPTSPQPTFSPHPNPLPIGERYGEGDGEKEWMRGEKDIRIGEFVEVEIVDTYEYDLVGKIIV